jgi:FMN phosphatase YigB (HAD superfamily)
MLALIRDLRAAGLRTGLLTNNARELRSLWWDLLPYDELFDDIVDSSEVGLRKPNPAVYRLALDRGSHQLGGTNLLQLDCAPAIFHLLPV